MNLIKKWMYTIRLHTLPLSLSGVILGSFISKSFFKIKIFILTCITAVLFQIIANLSNDYGDWINGIDNRISIASISIYTIIKTIIIITIISFLSSLLLIYTSFKDDIILAILFIIGALICILFALDYTINIIYAYGYKGWGDLIVFIFFGLISVEASYFLYTHQFNWEILIPASSIGFLSTGVLNINNMRDIKNDKENKKYTIAVKLGLKNAKIYHTLLMLMPIILSLIILYKHYKGIYQWIFMFFFSIIIFNHIKNIFFIKNFNHELKIISYTTLIYSLFISQWY
ncbi:MAG: 1,4-dihydroxy-2-naphthoate octaprenyltransferase [Candidatus Bostrichicola ureolyticus]|nr:MAG: 1,4-dihydroxy-2-naphthoate octaprenyltransferase [Candidatus Bostrichicola ureolyticus]